MSWFFNKPVKMATFSGTRNVIQKPTASTFTPLIFSNIYDPYGLIPGGVMSTGIAVYPDYPRIIINLTLKEEIRAAIATAGRIQVAFSNETQPIPTSTVWNTIETLAQTTAAISTEARFYNVSWQFRLEGYQNLIQIGVASVAAMTSTPFSFTGTVYAFSA